MAGGDKSAYYYIESITCHLFAPSFPPPLQVEPMPPSLQPDGAPAGAPDRAAVVLVNLGTPQAPTPAAVRRYLAQFLWDPRVIELPRWKWWPILQAVLLIRPRRSAHAYAQIWTEAGSPLL